MMRLAVIATPFFAAALVGCTKPSPPAPDTGAASASVTAAPSASASAAPSGKRGRRGDGEHRRAGGSPVARLLHEADELELTEAQHATVEKLQRELRPAPGARDDQKAARDELLAGVRAGKIDPQKLDARRADEDKAQAARHAKELEVLGALHAALSPAERKALVARLREQQGPRDAHATEKVGKGAPHGDPTGFATKRAERLTKQLELDPAQQKKLEAWVAKDRPEATTPQAKQAERDEARRRVEALWSAFEADTFDPKKLEPLPTAPRGKSRAARELEFLAGLLPILRPDQRERLAASMEKKYEHRGQGRPALFDD